MSVISSWFFVGSSSCEERRRAEQRCGVGRFLGKTELHRPAWSCAKEEDISKLRRCWPEVERPRNPVYISQIFKQRVPASRPSGASVSSTGTVLPPCLPATQQIGRTAARGRRGTCSGVVWARLPAVVAASDERLREDAEGPAVALSGANPQRWRRLRVNGGE
jgi:hypothetical protein